MIKKRMKRKEKTAEENEKKREEKEEEEDEGEEERMSRKMRRIVRREIQYGRTMRIKRREEKTRSRKTTDGGKGEQGGGDSVQAQE